MSWDEDGDEPCELGHGKIEHATAKALLVALDSGGKHWIPRSVIHDDSDVFDEVDANEGEVVVKTWWAEKEGLS